MPLPHLFASPPAVYASRREFLRHAGSGCGLLALAAMLDQQGLLSSPALGAGSDVQLNPMAPRPAHFAAKAKSVIWLFMNGGPSQVDTWDYKPELQQRDGQELQGFDKNTGFFTDQVGPLMKSPFKFQQHGQSAAWVSEIFPKMADHVDDMAFIHSCFTKTNNHSPALFEINTGMSRMGFPCMGAWVTYGLGTENQNLPGFITMYDTLGRGLPKGHAENWGAAFCRVFFRGPRSMPRRPINNLYRRADMTDAQQLAQLDLLRQLNNHQPNAHDADLAARIESFELAYRMQMAAPDALDIEREPAHIRQLYGVDNPQCTHFAKQVLTARRLVERGVRCVKSIAVAWRTSELGRPRQYWPEPCAICRRNRYSHRRIAHRLETARVARVNLGHLVRRIRPPANRAKRGHWP